jgi:hypothetical protein
MLHRPLRAERHFFAYDDEIGEFTIVMTKTTLCSLGHQNSYCIIFRFPA